MKQMRRAAWLVTVLVVGLLNACTTATRSDDGPNTRTDLLTREQIMSVTGATNLYEVVQRLRPRWLDARGGERSFGLSTDIVVYQDQTFLGDVDTLGQLSPNMAWELRWLDGTTASATLPGLGSRHVVGAIILSTKPRS